MISFRSAFILASAFVVIGCDTQPPKPVTLTSGLRISEPSAVILDPSGRRFALRQANVKRVARSRDKTLAIRTSGTTAPTAEWLAKGFNKDFSAMTEAELAEALRPVTLVGGHEYILEHPDWDAARQFKQRPNDNQTGGDGYNPHGSTGKIVRPKAFCCAPDGRWYWTNNTNWFEATTVALDEPEDPLNPAWRRGEDIGAGTAQMIGQNTATSVAHNFHDGTSWYPDLMWGAAPDGGDAQIFPTGYPGAYGCYWAFFPSAWVGSGNNIQYDFAILDFRNTCVTNPGNISGWQGWGSYNNTQMSSSGVDALGVPAWQADNVTHEPLYPRIRGMWITNSGYAFTTYTFSHNADCAIGDSGRGSTQFIDNGYRITAFHRDGPIAGKCRDRRLSADVDTFLRANSEF